MDTSQFMAALRSRKAAYQDVLAEDRMADGVFSGENARTSRGLPFAGHPGLDGQDPALRDGAAKITNNVAEGLAKIKAKMNLTAQDPLTKLLKAELRDVDMGVVDSRLAPEFLAHILQDAAKVWHYFRDMLTRKDLLETPVYFETRRLAQTVDDLLFFDGADVLNYKAVERLMRRLHGIEKALVHVKGRHMLHTVKWNVADEFCLSHLEGESFSQRDAEDEVKKRLEREYGNLKYALKLEELEKTREKEAAAALKAGVKGGKSD